MALGTMTHRPPTVNPYEHVGTALRDLRLAYADDKPRYTALNKAALNIIACHWAVFPDGVQIQSATNARRYWHVTDAGCDCPASGICWHMAALVLLRELGHVPTPAVDDFEEDDLGEFMDDDGQLHSLLERRLAPVTATEAAMDAREELALTADRYAMMSEDEINADLF